MNFEWRPNKSFNHMEVFDLYINGTYGHAWVWLNKVSRLWNATRYDPITGAKHLGSGALYEAQDILIAGIVERRLDGAT